MIKKSNITLAFICILIFVACLIGGFFFKPSFILAILGLATYLWIDKKYLRCPACGGFENLERLSYAENHVYHCRHCGEIIKIDTN